MHHFLYHPAPPHAARKRNPAFTLLAMLVLSLGVGIATSAFALVDDTALSEMAMHPCTPMLGAPSEAAMFVGEGVPRTFVLRQHLSGAYEMAYETVSDVDSSFSEALGDVDERTLAPFLGAAAIMVLVACARSTARLLDPSRSLMIAAGASIGALIAAACIVEAFGLPALGPRAIAFAISVSALTVKFAWSARKELLPAID